MLIHKTFSLHWRTGMFAAIMHCLSGRNRRAGIDLRGGFCRSTGLCCYLHLGRQRQRLRLRRRRFVDLDGQQLVGRCQWHGPALAQHNDQRGTIRHGQWRREPLHGNAFPGDHRQRPGLSKTKLTRSRAARSPSAALRQPSPSAPRAAQSAPGSPARQDWSRPARARSI